MAAPCKADGCAFFGSDATNGYCSKCYKIHVKQATAVPMRPKKKKKTTTPRSSTSAKDRDPRRQTIASTSAIPSAIDIEHTARNGAAAEGGDGGGTAAPTASAAGEQPAAGEEEAICSTSTMVEIADNSTSALKGDSTSHCHFCKTKSGLKFSCRCGGVYCNEHLHFTKHSCTFDYKEYGRAAIAKDNPTVVGPKFKKI